MAQLFTPASHGCDRDGIRRHSTMSASSTQHEPILMNDGALSANAVGEVALVCQRLGRFGVRGLGADRSLRADDSSSGDVNQAKALRYVQAL